MITCRAMLDVPRELAQYLSRLLHIEHRQRGTRKNSRALTCFRQDVEVTALVRDHGISRATGYQYLDEVIEVLASQAPDLHEALQKAKTDGLAYVVLDGKIFSADRRDEKTTSVTLARLLATRLLTGPRLYCWNWPTTPPPLPRRQPAQRVTFGGDLPHHRHARDCQGPTG